MAIPILRTKLYIPPPREKSVFRSHLIKRMNDGLIHKLTLISAPAGFGKTTLVSEWIANCKRPVAWLSIDAGDSDPIRFLSYIIVALQTIASNIGEGLLGVLQTSQLPPTETILTALINEITTISDEFILVLDDYHVIDGESVDNIIVFLIEHLPSQMHLVIVTREDPHISLTRLRARSQLTELRSDDLRFNPSEATIFLNQMMGLNLSVEDIASLEIRTEGWITGLQLAAISMQGRTDTAGFIKSFAGSHHFILDYLVEEVLQRQPEHIRNFLLQTSILDRLSSPLCDAVTEREDSKEVLNILECNNLFLIRLDDQRKWFRYHILFAEVLQTHLREAQPDRLPTFHQRASEWYKQNGLPSEAIRHALVAEDFEGAADMIELAWLVTEDGSLSTKFLGWAKALPDELVRDRPVLSVCYACALLGSGEMEAAGVRLTDAEQWLNPTKDINEQSVTSAAGTYAQRSRKMVVIDEERFRSLPATIAIARAYLAQALGDVSGTVTYARRALDLTHEADHFIRGQATALLGISYWASGDLEAANRIFVDYTKMLRSVGNILDAISTTFVMVYIQTALGRLHESVSTLEQLLHFIDEQGVPIPPDAADLCRGLGELYCEQGELEAAIQCLIRSKELGEQAELLNWQYRLCVALARIKQIQGNLDEALALLNEAERLFIRTPLPDIRPISALKVRIWITQGRLIEAQEWVREQNLSTDDTLNYLYEFEHMTLAKVYIARYKINLDAGFIQETLGLLERLLQAAEAGGRIGSMIEILVLQALAHQSYGNITSALAPLERALNLAEPEGYVRIFIDEGNQMAELLTKIDTKNKTSRLKEYILKLHSAFDIHKEFHPFSQQTLVEPLTERELEVLKFLRTDLNGLEIAHECIVSLSTIRTHTQNIYAKLGVTNRRAAIRRAEELDLL